jgi:hypothetical protein
VVHAVHLLESCRSNRTSIRDPQQHLGPDHSLHPPMRYGEAGLPVTQSCLGLPIHFPEQISFFSFGQSLVQPIVCMHLYKTDIPTRSIGATVLEVSRGRQ